ncbi:Gti1/Pac2 family-domain-containing protein [Phycomyces blakesleeanus]|uniref:Gti1/Pac2 family-domain-containing protein n=1 Tax=Phycomyces blakesleeanus TaxID=4837 RepID=A0ABR3B3Y3_PHYBL
MTPETFHGFIDTTADTLLIFEACRQGILPMINRRLQERERGAVCSGTVFVFDEKESGIKRWTDGMVWSPSRILGNFLIYRELDGKEPVNGKRALPKEEGFYEKRECLQTEQTSLDRSRERALVGSLSSSYKFKYGGLMKKTMSIMVNGSLQHLISYYSKEDVLGHKLATPSSIPHLACLRISPELLLRQSFRAPPTLDRQHNVFDKASSPASPPLITHTQPITPPQQHQVHQHRRASGPIESVPHQRKNTRHSVDGTMSRQHDMRHLSQVPVISKPNSPYEAYPTYPSEIQTFSNVPSTLPLPVDIDYSDSSLAVKPYETPIPSSYIVYPSKPRYPKEANDSSVWRAPAKPCVSRFQQFPTVNSVTPMNSLYDMPESCEYGFKYPEAGSSSPVIDTMHKSSSVLPNLLHRSTVSNPVFSKDYSSSQRIHGLEYC